MSHQLSAMSHEPRTKIKAIIFDFDGVIIESADIKTEAFRQLFSQYPDKVEEIVAYHKQNMGISRYVKFHYFYENILGKELSREMEVELGKRFSQLVLKQILKAPLVAGAKEFLSNNKDRYLFFIASGTPEDELHYIVTQRRLTKYFKGIYGTPRKKSEIIEDIMEKNRLSRNEVVYVGDAQSDQDAAEKAGVPFIARTSRRTGKLANCSYYMKDLHSLGEVVEMLSCRLRLGQAHCSGPDGRSHKL